MTQVAETKEYGLSTERLREHLSVPEGGYHAFKTLSDAEVRFALLELLERRASDKPCPDLITPHMLNAGTDQITSPVMDADEKKDLAVKVYRAMTAARASDKPSEAVAWAMPSALEQLARFGSHTVTLVSHKTELCTIPLFTSSEAGSGVTRKVLEDARHEMKVAIGYLDGSVEKDVLLAVAAGLSKRLSLMVSEIDATLTTQPAESAKSGDGVTLWDAAHKRTIKAFIDALHDQDRGWDHDEDQGETLIQSPDGRDYFAVDYPLLAALTAALKGDGL